MKNSRLLKRQEEIIQILTKKNSISVSTLADMLGVSGWTVRRDLASMAREGLVQRQHGVVSLTAPRPIPPFDTFDKRSRKNLAEKQRVGRAAARLLRPNQYVAIGAGTTTTQVARELARLDNKPMHIMTNALNIALDLVLSPNLQITSTGGDVRSDHYTLTGPVMERALRAHYYDIAVIGVSGVTLKEGLTVNSQLDSIALQIMIEQSRRLMVVADSSKVGQVHFVHLATLAEVDVMVMDRAAPLSFCKALTQMGIKLVLVDLV